MIVVQTIVNKLVNFSGFLVFPLIVFDLVSIADNLHHK